MEDPTATFTKYQGQRPHTEVNKKRSASYIKTRKVVIKTSESKAKTEENKD
jgi:hypothetical protein